MISPKAAGFRNRYSQRYVLNNSAWHQRTGMAFTSRVFIRAADLHRAVFGDLLEEQLEANLRL